MREKKYLGQHFLRNKKILEEIVRAGEISKRDVVWEVGPGHGELTELLAANAKKITAVEKDRDLIPLLQEKFRSNKGVKIIHGDALKIKNREKKFKIVANIPYYITSRFLKNILTEKNKPELIVLMVQYEVAKRICAKPPEINLLALSVQAYGKAEFVRKVPRGNFSPPPKVDSAIVKISGISSKFFKKNEMGEKKFFEILRRAFQQKRKMLRHSLKLSNSKFEKMRPEELSLQDWVEILKNHI